MQRNEIKMVILLIGFLIFGTYLLFLFTNKSIIGSNLQLAKNKIYYFFGNTCDHCQDLDKYLKEKKTSRKLKFEKLEVFENLDNKALMKQAVLDCKITEASVGVPFIYENKKCFIGIDEAKKFFDKKLK